MSGSSEVPSTSDPKATDWDRALPFQACELLGLTSIRPVDVATVGPPEYTNPCRALWQCAVEGAVGGD